MSVLEATQPIPDTGYRFRWFVMAVIIIADVMDLLDSVIANIAGPAIRASLGGLGILAVYLQDRFGWRAGLVQLAFDMVVLAAAFAVAAPFIVLCSVIGAVVLNLFLTINHRSDRYVAV